MKELLTAFLTILAGTSISQVDQTIWGSLRTVTTADYELQVPYSWRQIPAVGQGPEQLFEASGLALPTTYNGAPVIVTVFLVKQGCKDLTDCKQVCLDGYRNNPDREFPKGFKDVEEKITLKDGQEAYFLNTRFYRRSKGLDQSRFDMVVYSDRTQAGYIYTLSVQYADSEYKFESDNDLSGFAKKLFSYLQLKE